MDRYPSLSYTSPFLCPALVRVCSRVARVALPFLVVLVLGSVVDAHGQVPGTVTRDTVAAPGTVSREPPPAPDGVVLSGGGARGLAHVGALTALERLGYDPRIVAGTSMGAIVGALYAAGYSAAEVETLVMERDWPGMFLPMPGLYGPDRDLRHPSIRLDLGLGLGEPGRGIVADWRINRTLASLLFDAQARSRGDFDRLPRRFRAVAADLKTGLRVDLGQGDLARAVRASMAIPGAFAPVEWMDGRIFVDGAIDDYLPVRTARELGAEEIVAIDVTLPTPHIPSLDPVSVGARGMRLNLVNSRAGEPVPDVLLVPALDPRLTELGFPRNPAGLIHAGRDIVLDTYLALGVEPVPEGEAVDAMSRALPPPAALGPLVVEATDTALAAMARVAFADVAPGLYDPDAVLEAVDRLYETGLVSAVWPWVGPGTEDEDAPPLHVRVEGADEMVLDLAAGYENDRGGRAWGALQRRVGARLPTELIAAVSGDRLDWWASASVRALPPRLLPLAWTAGTHYRRTDARYVFDGEVFDMIRVRRTGGWLGAERRWLSGEGRRAEPPPVWLGRGRIASATLMAEHVSVEGGGSGPAIGPRLRLTGAEPSHGRIGLPLVIEGEARFGSFRYQRARFGGTLERRPDRSLDSDDGLWLGAIADVALARGDAPPDALPALGDERLIPGMRWGEARGRTRVVVGVDASYPAFLEALLFVRLRGGAITDRFRQLDDTSRWVSGAETGLAWSTPFGAVQLALGLNTNGGRRLDVVLGPVF